MDLLDIASFNPSSPTTNTPTTSSGKSTSVLGSFLDDIEPDDGEEKNKSSKSSSSGGKSSSIVSALAGLDLSSGGQTFAGTDIPKSGSKGQLLNSINGGGLQIDYEFLRQASIYSSKMSLVNVKLWNRSDTDLLAVNFPEVKGLEMRKFDEIARVPAGQVVERKLHIDFSAKATPVKLTVRVGEKEYPAKLSPEAGDLFRAHAISHEDYQVNQNKLSGMNEATVSAPVSDISTIPQKIVTRVHIAPLTSHKANVYRFSGRKLADNSILLIEISTTPDGQGSGGIAKVTVNCDDFMLSGQLIDTVKKCLA